ncbi:hypothetical protein FKM82_020337 [Ascaphus truei]
MVTSTRRTGGKLCFAGRRDDSIIKKLNQLTVHENVCGSVRSAVEGKPPASTMTIHCSKSRDADKEGCFYFRDKIVPDRVGKYCIQFVFMPEKTLALHSEQMTIDVIPNQPVRLVPYPPPSTPTVSNIKSAASRTLLKNLLLKIVVKLFLFLSQHNAHEE